MANVPCQSVDAQLECALRWRLVNQRRGARRANVKTYQIELQRVRGMSNGGGLIEAQIDAQVMPVARPGEGAPTTLLSMTEDTARVLQLLLKNQLAEVDRRKARSQR